MKRFIVILLAIGFIRAQDITPPDISAYGANPNPFSPNGDGRADSTQISFGLSEPTYMWVWESSTGMYLISGFLYSPGTHTITWDGFGLPEGPHEILFTGEDTAGNWADTVSLTIVIDTTPPSITNLSFTPNPFSPDNNGIEDYCKIEFTVVGTHDPDYDMYFPPNKIGTLIVYRDSLGQHDILIPDHSPLLPPFPVYLFVVVNYSNLISNLTLNFADWGGNIVQVVIPPNAGPVSFRVGDLTNRFEDIVVWSNPLTVGDSAVLSIYAFTGNATIEVFDSLGNRIVNANMWEKFRGDGTYFILWGPGPIPDGLYNVKVTAEDEAYNLDRVSGDVIANSVPTTVSNVYPAPSKISPENHDFLFDAANIHYTLSEPAHVTVRVYNSSTQFDSLHLVRTLLEDVPQIGGEHSVTFDGKNDDGEYLAPGADSTYYIRITVSDPITGDIATGLTSIEIDNLPPGAPSLLPLPTPTSMTFDTLEGVAEPGARIRVFRNFLFYTETQSDSVTGHFEVFVEYSGEDNRFYAIALDDVLNAGPPSETLRVIVDQVPPYVLESHPPDASIETDTIARVWTRLADNLAGVNFNNSTIVLKKSGISIPGVLQFSPPDTLVFTLTDPLAPGGSDDGLYTMEITIFDSAGNNSVDTSKFTYDTSPPGYTFNPVDSSIVNRLDSLTLTIRDQLSGPSSMNSEILLVGPNGEVPGQIVSITDSELVFYPVPPLRTDGSDDGRYFPIVTVSDQAGNQIVDTTTYLYDTQAPIATVIFPPPDSAFAGQISRVFVVITDSVVAGREPSGLDLQQSTIYLLQPDGNVHPGHKILSADTLIWALNQPLTMTGSYTIVAYVYDHAGNIDTLNSQFFYDPENPVVIYSEPADGEAVNGLIESVMVVISDGQGSGIVLDTTVTLLQVYDESWNNIPGNVVYLGTDTVKFNLFSPLLPNGSQDGLYRILVYAQDRVGNTLIPNPETLAFVFDNLPPWVESVTPNNGAMLTNFPDSMTVEISDLAPGIGSVSGPDFITSNITVLAPNGQGVPGIKHYRDDGDGTGAISWIVNGSYTPPWGNYQILIHIFDRSGNTFSDTFDFTLYPTSYVNAIVYPEDGASIRDTLRKVFAVLEATSGAGINFDTTVTWIKVFDRSGQLLPGYLTHTDSTVEFIFVPPLNPNGSLDGRYTIILSAQDNIGNQLPQNPDTTQFIFDNLPPSVTSAYPGDSTYPTLAPDSVYIEISDLVAQFMVEQSPSRSQPKMAHQLASGLRSIFKESPGSRSIRKFSKNLNRLQSRWETDNPHLLTPEIEVSGIDFEHSTIFLIAPDGSGVPGVKHIRVDSPETGALIWVTEPNYTFEYGWYTVQYSVLDLAGNEYEGEFSFRYTATLPVEVNVFPSQSISGSVDTIRAWVNPLSGAPVDFEQTTLTLLDPQGITLPGNLTNNSVDTVYLTLTLPLNPDGTMDGKYRVILYTQDMAGNTPEQNPDTFKFVYDNLPPTVTDRYPETGASRYRPPDSVYISITDIYAWTDTVTGINFQLSRVRLFEADSTTPVPGTFRFHDLGNDSGLLVFDVTPDYLWNEGPYIVSYSLYDNEGNVQEETYSFLMVGARPMVLELHPDSGTYTTSLDTLSVLIWDPTGTGISQSQTITRLIGPSGEQISGNVTFVQVDTLYWLYFMPQGSLDQGTYTFEIQPIANNGSQGDSRVSIFYYDPQKPQVIGTTPSNGSVNYTPVQTFLIRYIEDGSGLDTSALLTRVEDVSTNEIVSISNREITDTTILLTFSTAITYGTYRVIMRLKDIAGNVVQDTVAFTVLLPVVINPGLAQNDTLYGPAYYIPAYIYPVGGNVIANVSMEVYRMTAADSIKLPGHTSHLGDSLWTFVYDTTLPGDGSANGFYRLWINVSTQSGVDVSMGVTFTFLFDTIPPVPPALLPPVPEVVETTFFDIQGQAEPASKVLLYVNNPDNPVDSTYATLNGYFLFRNVPLEYAKWNNVGLRARDNLGNTSNVTTIRVYSGPMPFTVEFPKPFTREEAWMAVSTPEPARLVWRVYNLAGDLVYEYEADFTKRLTKTKITWSGLRNIYGQPVMNGPYIYIVEAHLKKSNRIETKKGVLAVVR